MKASVVDLRYRMNDVLKALARNEEVHILNRGRLKGVIKPADSKSTMRVSEHPFFKMLENSGTVEQRMDRLRGGRYRDL
ncbi:MAG: type II toxin-antitoxin system Phd/YefM family antitoxin [Phycisphaerales bacterium]